jgi:hypothetical protein
METDDAKFDMDWFGDYWFFGGVEWNRNASIGRGLSCRAAGGIDRIDERSSRKSSTGNDN